MNELVVATYCWYPARLVASFRSSIGLPESDVNRYSIATGDSNVKNPHPDEQATT
jgi:hypothetical protein